MTAEKFPGLLEAGRLVNAIARLLQMPTEERSQMGITFDDEYLT